MLYIAVHLVSGTREMTINVVFIDDTLWSCHDMHDSGTTVMLSRHHHTRLNIYLADAKLFIVNVSRSFRDGDILLYTSVQDSQCRYVIEVVIERAINVWSHEER